MKPKIYLKRTRDSLLGNPRYKIVKLVGLLDVEILKGKKFLAGDELNDKETRELFDFYNRNTEIIIASDPK